MKRIFWIITLLWCAMAHAQCNPPAYVGPPNYPCTSTSTSNPGAINFLFTSTAPTATTCSGNCQNSTAEDTTLPGHVSGSTSITRISDGANTYQGRSVTGATVTNGEEDHMFSYPNGTYIWAVENGLMQVWQLSIGNPVQVVNAGCTPLTLSEGAAFSTSWLNDRNFYYFTDGSQAGSEITEGTLTGSGCSLAYTTANVVDIMGADVCPGISQAPFAMNWKGLLTVSSTDDEFVFSTAAGAQGSADWVIAWSRTRGCSTANFATGTVYGWCTSACGSATALGTFANNSTTCWGTNGAGGYGIHATVGSFDGAYIEVTPVYSVTYPSKGGCVGIGSTQAGYPFWQIGTLGNQWCANDSSGTNYLCAAHSSFGLSLWNSPGGQGWVIRPESDVTAYTQYAADPNTEPQGHVGWSHNNNGTYDDTLPIIGTNADGISGSGCGGTYTTAVYCPTYFNNIIYTTFPHAVYPPGLIKVIAHTGSCNDTSDHCMDGIADNFGTGEAIGIPSPKGDMEAWGSTMWHQMGNDNGAAPRSDLFIVYLGAPGVANSGPSGVPTPATFMAGILDPSAKIGDKWEH